MGVVTDLVRQWKRAQQEVRRGEQLVTSTLPLGQEDQQAVLSGCDSAAELLRGACCSLLLCTCAALQATAWVLLNIPHDSNHLVRYLTR